jgi:hypothetical protein
MAALTGSLDEWTLTGRNEAGQEQWSRKDHPEDGVVTLREGLTFKDYYAKRAEPEPLPIPSVEDRLKYLEAEVERLKKERADARVARS